MKKYLITVNGNQYEVEVEEVRDNTVSAPAVQAEPAVRAAAPAQVAAAPAPAPKPAAASSAVPAGATHHYGSHAGNHLEGNVSTGDAVKKARCFWSWKQ